MSAKKGRASRYRHRIRIERPVAGSGLMDAGSGSWALVANAWGEVKDVLPSRDERLATGINMSTRQARVRMAFRTDIRGHMRFVCGTRVMQIIGGPAEVGFREEVEFMAEDYSSAGNSA